MKRRRPMLNAAGGTRAWSKTVREYVAVNRVCWLQLPGVCTMRATTIDHYHTRKHRPDLADVPFNWRPACRPCNLKRGDTPPHLIPALRARCAARAGRRRRSSALGFFD
jgi:5-methylcytosine-specific restriction endonuclease McrA